MADPTLTRRQLLAATPAAAAAALLPGQPAPTPSVPVAAPAGPPRPVALASGNGLAAVALAVERMAAGSSPVDAAVAGVGLLEEDPEDVTVGYGGLPNEDGVVQLDAAVMDGDTMRAGAVAALERIKHPARVALEIMRRTTRVMLVGDGALAFARAHGFPEENLLTERARKIWLYWKENASERDDWLADPGEVDDPDLKWFISKYGQTYFRPPGTVHLSACAGNGSLACCTSTSGLFFKLPGRVGDSPLPGCGLYCDPDVGSAGATGHGESCIVTAGAHTVVGLVRHGDAPEQACLHTLERVVRNTRVAWLRDDKGRPRNNLSLYAVNRAGEVGSAATFSGARYAVAAAGAPARLADCAYLFKR